MIGAPEARAQDCIRRVTLRGRPSWSGAAPKPVPPGGPAGHGAPRLPGANGPFLRHAGKTSWSPGRALFEHLSTLVSHLGHGRPAGQQQQLPYRPQERLGETRTRLPTGPPAAVDGNSAVGTVRRCAHARWTVACGPRRSLPETQLQLLLRAGVAAPDAHGLAGQHWGHSPKAPLHHESRRGRPHPPLAGDKPAIPTFTSELLDFSGPSRSNNRTRLPWPRGPAAGLGRALPRSGSAPCPGRGLCRAS